MHMTSVKEIQPLIDKVSALGYQVFRIHRWELCSYGDSLKVPASESCAAEAKYFVDSNLYCVKHTEFVCERIISHEKFEAQKCSFCAYREGYMLIFWKTDSISGERTLLAVTCGADNREFATLFRELEDLDPTGKIYTHERLTSENVDELLGKTPRFRRKRMSDVETWVLWELGA